MIASVAAVSSCMSEGCFISLFSFDGAKVRVFWEMGKKFSKKSEKGADFCSVPLCLPCIPYKIVSIILA